MISKDLIVVGIGSSAGGLEALQVVLSKVEKIDKCAFIIAQHLSPTHKSMMTDLLSRITNLPVLEIKNAMVIKPKTIYMTPENNDVYVSNGKIYLTNIEQTYGPKPSVNYFFNSLAQSFKNRAVGIILSGTGSDGAFGIRAIKASGGITIAQSPSTSKYDGMPISAINTGKVDLVIPLEDISYELSRIVENLDISVCENINEDITTQLYQIIYNEKGVDFSQYKKSTLIRRIERRLATLRINSLAEYVNYLKNDKDEITNLYNDILIGVTEFFRDKEVFDKAYEYIKQILDKKEQGEEIRFWSIACSTGEEAYSLAILISEVLQDKVSKYKIKIFATDIDDESLKIARMGVYAETSLVNIKKEYIQKYFTVQKNQFEVKKSIRELVIFSRHNIISDSPFLRIDFASCRNVLIYFTQELQNRFFPVVHYALKENAILMLGKSESVGSNLDLFIPIEKDCKIFKAQYTGIKEPPKLYSYQNKYRQYEEPKQTIQKNEEEILEDKVVEATLEYMLNQCVVINSSNEIIYVKGKIPYLEHSQGKASNNIFKCINEELVLDLRSTINQAQKQKKTKTTPIRNVVIFDNIVRYVKIVVIPLSHNNDDYVFALFFQTEEMDSIHTISQDISNENEYVKKLTTELSRTKAHLQNVIEELETSYEEMQSLNEELSSSNEELQSTNEELETTNEELQSTNEELQTAYTELKILYDDRELKTKQLEEITITLQSQQKNMKKQQELTDTIIHTVPVGIIMLDIDGRVTLMNNNAKKILDLDDLNLNSNNYDNNIQLLIENNLPFEIIKKSQEPIYKIEHVIEKENESKIFITVNGVPIFDEKSYFMGAVFSIVDNLSTVNLINNKSLNIQNLDLESQFDIVQIGMIDIASNVQNYISDLSLLTQAMGDLNLTAQSKSKIQKDINQIISDINTIINSNLNFYQDLFFLLSANFLALFKRYIKIFEHILASQNIKIIDKIDSKLDLKCDPKKATILIMDIISKIVKINQIIKQNKQLSIKVSFDSSKSKLVFDFGKTDISLINSNDIQINLNDKNIKSIVFKDSINTTFSFDVE